MLMQTRGVFIGGGGICRLYAVQGGIALSPSKKAKYVSYNTKINTITSQQMVFFQARNALKTVFGGALRLTPLGKFRTLPQAP